MTILEYITPSRMGGAEETFLRMVVYLRSRGHRVIVVTKRDTPLRHELERVARPHGVEVHGWLTHGKFDPYTIAKLCRLIRREHVDVIHTHLTTASWNGNIVGRLTGVPTVAHVHGADSKTWFQWAHYLIAVAKGVKEHLMAQGVPACKIPVLYYGLDLKKHKRELSTPEAKAALGLPRDVLTVGVVASLIERKGHKYLLQAIKQFEARLPHVHAVFAGEGPLLGELEQQAKQLGLAERVHFLGFRRDVDTVFSACDVVALPSFKEGLSIAAMEAMVLGCPVVVTNVAGMPEVVRQGETGLLVPPGDVAALASALEELLSDEQKRQCMAERARRFVIENFDQEHCQQRIEEFLMYVVEQQRRGQQADCTRHWGGVQ